MTALCRCHNCVSLQPGSGALSVEEAVQQSRASASASEEIDSQILGCWRVRGQSRPAEDGDRAQPPGRRGLAPRLPPDLGAAAGGAESAAALPGPGLAAAPGADLPPAARGGARQRRVRQEGQEARTRHTR